MRQVYLVSIVRRPTLASTGVSRSCLLAVVRRVTLAVAGLRRVGLR